MTDICSECLEHRPGDERVEAGYKCNFCAYGIFIAKTEMSEAEIDYAIMKHEEMSDADLTDGQSEAHTLTKKER